MYRTIDNRYQILEKLGAGAMGEVHKVKDLKDNRIIALKMLSKTKTSSETVQRFKREFSLLVELHHPNLCAVYDFGIIKDGRSYFTMEYIEGRDIFSTTKELPEKSIYPLIVQLCQVLEYIHAKGLIHYDIKPGNVLVRDGTVKLTDFGLADEQRIKGGAFIKGTFPYIAPEVIKGLSVDHRSDLYSLGVLSYEIFTHKRLQKLGEDSFVTLLKKMADWISILPSKITSNTPRHIGQLISKLIAFEPAARFSHANEVIKEINKISDCRFELETGKTLEGYLLSSRFVGREKEMDLLRQYYEKARQGEGKVILISGDAGIGKSRLLGEFKVFTQLQRGHCFMGEAHKEKTRPLEPFYNIFSELINYLKDGSGLKMSLAVLFKIFPDLADGHLRKHLPKLVPLDPESERIRTFDALTELIKSIVLELGELVILLEDLHWTDDLTIQFLEYLGRNLEDSKIFICGTCRKEALTENPLFQKMITNLKSSGYFQQLELRPLNFKNLYSFLDSTITSKSNSPSLVKYLIQKTGGNPYFVEEIMRTFLKEKRVNIGERIEVKDFQGISIPKKIEDVVLKRIEDLDEASLMVVKFGAILLKDFNYNLMKRLTDVEDTELSAALWDLKRRQVLVEKDNKYQFYHASLREALNKRMGDKERRVLNYQIGKTLEKINRGRLEHVIEDLAHYFINAKDYKKGIKYGLRAAQKSSERYANEQAVSFYKGVLSILVNKNSELCFEILYKLAYVESTIGNADDAIRHYNEALSLRIGTINNRIDIYRKIANIYEVNGNALNALEINRKMLRYVRTMKSGWLKSLFNSLANASICRAYQILGDYKNVNKVNLDIIDFPTNRLKNNNIIRLLIDLYSTLGLIEHQKGEYSLADFDRALHYFRKAYKYCNKLKDERTKASILTNFGICYYLKSDYQRAGAYFQKSIQMSKKIGYQSSVLHNLFDLGNIFIQQGNYIKAVGYYQQVIAVAQKIGNIFMVGNSLSGLGVCFLRMCDYEKAKDCLERSLRMCDDFGWKYKKVFSLRSLGSTYQYTGDYSISLKLYKEALKISKEIKHQQGASYLLINLGRLFTELGEFGWAKKYVEKALRLADDVESNYLKIDCQTILGLVALLTKDFKLSLHYCEDSLNLIKKFGSIDYLPPLLLLSSEINYHLQKYVKGSMIADRVIKMAKQMRTKGIYAEALLIKAKNELGQGILTKVEIMRILNEAKGIAEEIGNPEIQWKTYYEYGRFLQNNQEYLEALEYYQKCNIIFLDVTSKIKNETLRRSYLNRADRHAVEIAINEIESA